MTTAQSAKLIYIACELEKTVMSGFLCHQPRTQFRFLDLGIDTRTRNYIIKNQQFLNRIVSPMTINNDEILVTQEDFATKAYDNLFEQLVRVIPPLKIMDDSFESFDGRYISHSAYSSCELQQLKNIATDIFNTPSLFHLYKSRSALVNIFQLLCFLKIFNYENKHRWRTFIRDVSNGIVTPGAIVDQYFTGLEMLKNRFRNLSCSNIPCLLELRGDHLILSDIHIKNPKVLSLYVIPQLDLDMTRDTNRRNLLAFKLFEIIGDSLSA